VPSVLAETAASAPAPGQLDLAGLKRLWDAVLDAVKKRSRTAHALMMSAHVESLEGNVVTLSFKTATLATRFANDVADFVTEALSEVVGLDLKLRATSAGGAPVGGPTAGVGAASPYPSSTAPAEAPMPAADDEPDEVDLTDSEELESSPAVDPADAALSLVKDSLGAQVIGEIDAS
jgi:DNA polymerase-3 subunit gamma/tau